MRHADYDTVTFAVSSSLSVAILALYSHLLREHLHLDDFSTITVSILGFLIFMISQTSSTKSPITNFDKSVNIYDSYHLLRELTLPR